MVPTTIPFTPASAVAELVEELGVPEIVASGVRVWRLHENGDGIESVRMSNRDVQNGETAMTQLEPIRLLSNRLRLRPRLLVVSFNNSGGSRFEERPDLELVEEAIAAGWCRWVGLRGVDRIAREDLPFALFYDLLKRRKVSLYLAELGRAVDWRRDRSELRLRGWLSVEERETIRDRTHAALERNWVKTGRGWPSKRPFGFRRNQWTKFLEPDPEQWPYVKLIHYRYAELEDGRRTGVRRLAVELAAAGCELSATRIRSLLRDLVYVTGEYTFTYGGETMAGAPIALDDPIPLEVWERNQELLGLRSGKNTRTPDGFFCLNGIRLLHQPCSCLTNARGQRPVLKGRIHPGRAVYAYRHEPWVPTDCRGFVIDRDVLEPPVLRALLDAAIEGPAADAWDRAVCGGGAPTTPIANPSARRHVEHQITQLERSRAQLTRSFRERLVSGERLNELAYHDLVQGIDGEIRHLQDYLALADAVDARPFLPPPIPQDRAWERVLTDTLTADVPDDLRLRLRRAALVEALVDEVVVFDCEGDALRVEIRGPLLAVGSRRDAS